MAKRGDFVAFNRSNPELHHLTTQGLAMASPKRLGQWKFAWMREDGSRIPLGARAKWWSESGKKAKGEKAKG